MGPYYVVPAEGDELIEIALDASERHLLRCGITEWGGPAHCTTEMAIAIGFDGVEDLFAQSDRLVAAVASEQPMSRRDWFRVVVGTEVVFASTLLGSGLDWTATTGLSDAESLATLRQIQRKVAPHHIGPARESSS